MNGEARCECCDLPTSSCGRVVEQQQRAEAVTRRQALIDTRRWFPSSYRGQCADCGDWFAAGDLITPQLVDGERRWVAQCCADEAATNGART